MKRRCPPSQISLPLAWRGVVLLLSLWLTACDETGWNPFQIHRDVRHWRQVIKESDEELATLPDPHTVAQAHQRIGFHGRPGSPAWIMLDLGHSVTPDEVVLISARVSDPAPDDPVGGFPPEVSCWISESGEPGSFNRMAEWREVFEGVGRDLPFLRLPNQGYSGRHVRIEVRGSRARARGQFFTLGEVVVLEKGVNQALGQPVTTGPSIENLPRWTAANLTDGYLWCGSLTGVEKSGMNGFHSAIETSPEAVPKWVEVDLGESMPVDEIRLVPARPADFADIAGFGFPPSFQVMAMGENGDESRILQEGDLPNPGDASVCIPGKGVSARRIRVVATSLWQRSQDYIFALAEMQVFSKGKNVALGKIVSSSDAVTSGIWAPSALVDGFSSQRVLLDWPTWLDAVERRTSLERNRASGLVNLSMSEAKFQQSLLRGIFILTLTLILLGLGFLFFYHGHQTRERARLRQRIAQDLHDEMGSQLSHLALLAEAGERQSDKSETAPSFANIANEARDLQHTMRDLVWLLEPQSGDACDFAVRLRTTCQRLLEPAIQDIRIEVSGTPPNRHLPLEWTRDLLLLVKESVNNCARHSQASKAHIKLSWTDTTFEWSLVDDGQGFDENAPDFESGAGLRNLRLRAVSLRAELRIISKLGSGTLIHLTVPLPKQRSFRFIA